MFETDELLAKYEAYHKNRLNVATHFIGIPLIVFGLFIPHVLDQFHCLKHYNKLCRYVLSTCFSLLF